jgi:hypothetical protein
MIKQKLEEMALRPFLPVGKFLFWISLLDSEITGWIVARSQSFSGESFLMQSFLQMLTASLFFFVLYGFLFVHLLEVAEQKHGTQIEKPGLFRGLFYALLIPVSVCGIGFLTLSDSYIYG